MDWLTTLTTALGSAWLSGINLYATVATLGLLQRLGLARLPGDLTVLSHGWIIALAVGLYVIVFLGLLVLLLIGTAWLVPRIVRTLRRIPALLRGASRDASTPSPRR